jgi:hypothetical protein
MLAQLQCWQRGKRMSMFAGADHNRVEFVGVIEDAAEVRILASTAMCLRRAIEIVRVHVAEGGDMFGRDGLQIAAASTATTDHGNPQFVET